MNKIKSVSWSVIIIGIMYCVHIFINWEDIGSNITSISNVMDAEEIEKKIEADISLVITKKVFTEKLRTYIGIITISLIYYWIFK